MRLSRSHGLGNDYLVLEEGTLTPAIVAAVCDRHTGVGSDGILEPVPGQGADYGLRIHNPDGSEAEKSGNGLRIYAEWLVRVRGAPTRFTVSTRGGIVGCEVEGENVRVTMGRARILGEDTLAGERVTRVDVGNPHAVVLGIPEDWLARGERVERSVPGRTNVQFIEVLGEHSVRVRVWERGAGHTLSSGSSACAVATVAVSRGLVRSPVEVEMEGGTLTVAVSAELDLTLDGPVEHVGTVEVSETWLGRRAATSR
jgi:diaminopimelate epimerase